MGRKRGKVKKNTINTDKKFGVRIYISNLQKRVKINEHKIKYLAQKILSLEKKPNYSISFVFVDNKKIKEINKIYLHRNTITDVIAFPLLDKFSEQDKLLGEVIVSVEKALKESRTRKITFEEELLRYCIHGILHLLDYDDKTPAKAKKMWARQEDLLEKFENELHE